MAPPAGSKILISNLPPDVSEREVEELFQKTVGPLREVLLVYNSQGRSKGMAVVAFQRAGDAAVAREKYNDKVVDGRRPIKIEIVTDEVPSAQTPSAAAPQLPSLLQRLGVKVPTGTGKSSAPVPTAPRPRAVAATVNNATRAVMAQPRRRVKKGARRVNKRPAPKTAADLDKEMDAYRAGSSEAA